MAISSPGIGSGLDVNAIVSQLVALEQKPLQTLATKAAGIQSKLSALGQMKSQVSTLSDQATKLATASTWEGMKFSSSSTAVVTGTATATATAANLSMEVSQLARAQSAATGAIAFPAGSGTLSIQLGQWSGGSFDTQTGDPVTFAPAATAAIDVTIANTDTLAQVASKINAANAGVSATVMRDGSGERLVFQSTTTGEAAGFRIAVTDDDGDTNDGLGLSRLGFNPQGSSDSMTLSQTARDTKATINGVAVTSANNKFEEAFTGVSLTVNQVSTTPVTIKVTKDTDTMRAAINGFVSAYNATMSALGELTKYNAATKTAGALQGDSTATGLQSSLRRLVGEAGPQSGTFSRLSDLGIELQLNGTLKVSDTKLATALEKPDNIKNLMSLDSGDTATSGLGVRFKSFASKLLTDEGSFATRTKSLQSAIDRNTKDQATIADRIDRTQTRLYAQYARLDTNLAKLTALNSYVSQQVTTWNNQNYNN